MNCVFEFVYSDFLFLWKWKKSEMLSHRYDESVIKTDGKRIFTIESNGRTARLKVTNFTLQDVGDYSCYKRYLFSGKPEMCEWSINVLGMLYTVTSSSI